MPWRRAAILAGAMVGALPASTAGAAPAGPAVMRAAATPAQVRVGSPPRHPRRSKVVGGLATGTQLPVTVTLKPRDPAALAAYAAGVSTPGSPIYHHYLSVSAFRDRFGPTAQDIAAVQSSLVASGLRPGPVSANGLAIPVSATAGELGHAFSLSFQKVALATGRTAFANTQAPQFNASVAGNVQGVIGLDSLAVPHPQGIRTGTDRAKNPRALQAECRDGRPTGLLDGRRHRRRSGRVHGRSDRVGVPLLEPVCRRRRRGGPDDRPVRARAEPALRYRRSIRAATGPRPRSATCRSTAAPRALRRARARRRSTSRT